MNTTLSDQINAIQTARRGAALLVTEDSLSAFDAALNDAGSTIAALNLNPDREERVKQLEEALKDTVKIIESGWHSDSVWGTIEKAKSLLS